MSRQEIEINGQLRIPLADIRFSFSRSGGKGGQNVNKVETKVELRYDLLHSPSLNDEQRSVLMHRLRSRLDDSGDIRVIAQESRSQWKNREEAIRKFSEMLRQALRPVLKRKKTRIPAAQKQKRLDDKRRRGEIKRMRSGRD